MNFKRERQKRMDASGNRSNETSLYIYSTKSFSYRM